MTTFVYVSLQRFRVRKASKTGAEGNSATSTSDTEKFEAARGWCKSHFLGSDSQQTNRPTPGWRVSIMAYAARKAQDDLRCNCSALDVRPFRTWMSNLGTKHRHWRRRRVMGAGAAAEGRGPRVCGGRLEPPERIELSTYSLRVNRSAD